MTAEQLYHARCLQYWGRAIESELTLRLNVYPFPEDLCIEPGFFVSEDQYSFPYLSTLDGIEEEAQRVVDLLLKRDEFTKCQVVSWCLDITRNGRIQYKRQFRRKTS